ncbi:hypothetical protein ABZ710_11150 [Streptomyces anthocyanicus]|uniref:hypothetical protein n=1 Tax=Streptomyces anthocyanicus TaxID=68174 RepID=UPI0033E1F406
MLNALEVFTTVIVGLMVGVEFSVAFVMNRIFNALPEDSGQLARAHGGRMLGALMPFWYIGSLVLSAVWAVAGWDRSGAGLVVIAAALLIVSRARQRIRTLNGVQSELLEPAEPSAPPRSVGQAAGRTA